MNLKEAKQILNRNGYRMLKEEINTTLQDAVTALVEQGFDREVLNAIIFELHDMGCDKNFITRHFVNLNDSKWLENVLKKGLTPYQIALKLSNMGA